MAKTDPVEELVQVVRRADARLPDTARARGAAALAARLAEEGQQPTPAQRRHSPVRLWAALGVAAAAALLLTFAVRRPVVVTVPSPVRVLPEKPAALPAPPPTAVPDERAILHTLSARGQQRLEAKPGEVVRAALGDHGRLVLRESGRVTVEDSSPSGIVLGLEHGTLLVSYDQGGRALAVRTRDALVRVTGTVFAVEASEGPTRVTVVRGAVQVEAAGLPVAVAAGKRWQIGAKGLSAPEASVALALRELGGSEESRPSASHARAPMTAEPKRAVEPAPAQAPPETAPPRPDGEADAEARYRRAEEALAVGQSDAAKAQLLGLLAAHPSSHLSGPATYELGRIDFAARDFASARARFASLRASDRADAARFREPAAFLVCRSEQELGHENAAITCLERYRHDFPHAPHAGDALAALALLRLDARDCARALPLVDDYLASYPGGEHTAPLKVARKRCHE